MYDEVAKKASMKYNAEKRENLNLNLPKGRKEYYKAYAKKKGVSLTELLVSLVEQDMRQNGYPLPTDNEL